MTGQEILEEVRQIINDPAYTRFNEINRAYRRICQITKFNWLRERSETLLSIKSGVTEYYVSMPKVRVLQRIWVKEPSDYQRWKLMEEVPPQLFEEKVADNRNNDATDDTKRPEFYKLEGGPTRIITVTPTPDQDYTARVDYIKHYQQIGREDMPVIPEAYHDTIVQMAAGYILETSPDPIKQQYASRLLDRTANESADLVRDTHANRTENIDRVPTTWLR